MKQRLKHNFKAFVLRTAPGLGARIQTAWQKRHVRRFEDSLGLPALAREFTARHGHYIQGGPFMGMAYIPQAVGSALVPKLVGSYEQELHGILADIAQMSYTVIIDVGCAEGYYAVGLARALEQAQVYAFDIDPEAQALCQATAETNGVSARIHVAGKCDSGVLERLLHGRALVISDCEGYERELLDLAHAPGLRYADMLVELHDAAYPGLTPELTARFAPTHEIQMIDSEPRNGCDYTCLEFLPLEQRHLAVNEFRPLRQQWAFFRAKQAEPQEGA